MKIQQFLEHHGVAANPFAEEDAQTDPVFKDHCIASTYHPTWDKIYGNPADPSTSIVFGEKGAGKTAMRLQIAQHLAQYNREHPGQRVFVIEYDDFNPFLDRFRDKLPARHQREDRALAEWKLWDHMDAILSLGVTDLVDRILGGNAPEGEQIVANDKGRLLDRHQSRDLLMLAACYDHSSAETLKSRWHRLRRRLKFSTWQTQWDLWLGIGTTTAFVALAIWLMVQTKWEWLESPWFYLLLVAGWGPRLWRMWQWFWQSRSIVRSVRIGKLQINPLRQILMNFSTAEVAGQPMPNKDRTDDRYALMEKFQSILKTLGFAGVIVLVDRLDEPHLINGSADQMKALLWPMLDNKFLKHPGFGFKLLLPIELTRFMDREERDFYQRARLDKQNMIPSLEWTGEALYDVANSRIRACAIPGKMPSFREFFDPSIQDRRLIDALRALRVPRHLFKFLYRLLVAHCNAHTDDKPVWQIAPEMFESVFVLYSRDQDAFDRGLKAG